MENGTNDAQTSPKLYLTDFSFSRFWGMKFGVIITKEDFTNRSQRAHLHDFVHIWYCTEGCYLHTVDQTTYRCGKGSVIVVPPGMVHSIDPIPGENVEMLSVDIAYSLLFKAECEDFLNLLSNVFLPVFSEEHNLNISTFFCLSEDSQKNVDLILSDLILQIPMQKTTDQGILRLLETFFSLPEMVIENGSKDQAKELLLSRVMPVLKAVDYLNENSQKKLYIKNLMKISALCQTNFGVFFKKLMGMSPSIYLQRLRVARAMFFLAHTNQSIHYISDYCGFNSPSHMIYCFKKHAQTVPKQSRRVFNKFLSDFPERELRVFFE